MIYCIILFANSFFAVEASLVVNKFGLDLFVNNYLIPLYKPDITLFRTWNDFKYHQGFEYQSLRLVNKHISGKLKYEFSEIRKWVDTRKMPAGFLLKYPEDDLSAEEKKYLQFIAACKDNTLTKDQFSYYSEYIYSTATGYLLYTYFSQHVTDREPFEKSLYAEFMKFSLDFYKQGIRVQEKIFKKLELETTVLNFFYNDPFLYNSNESFLLFISDQQIKTSIPLSMEISNCALLNLAQSPTESLERLVAVVDQDYTYIEKLWLLKFIYKDSFNSPIDEREIQRTTPIYYGYGRNAQKKTI